MLAGAAIVLASPRPHVQEARRPAYGYRGPNLRR
jgi:hypothetical protein